MASATAAAAQKAAQRTALLNIGALSSAGATMYLSWRRENHGPVFSFWGKFQANASQQLHEAQTLTGTLAEQTQLLWLERAFVEYTGSPAGTTATILRREMAEMDEAAGGHDARVPAPLGKALAAGRNAHSAEIYVTMAGHVLGGLVGYQSRAMQTSVGLRPLLCALFCGGVTGIMARYFVPEAILAGSAGRKNVVEAQRDFVRFLTESQLREAATRSKQAA
jgi:hypothetical protein